MGLARRPTQRRGDSWKSSQPNRWSTYSGRLRPDAHQFQDALDFLERNAYPSLPLGAALPVVDRDRLSAEDEQASIRLAQPVIPGRHGDPETLGGLRGSQWFDGHADCGLPWTWWRQYRTIPTVCRRTVAAGDKWAASTFRRWFAALWGGWP